MNDCKKEKERGVTNSEQVDNTGDSMHLSTLSIWNQSISHRIRRKKTYIFNQNKCQIIVSVQLYVCVLSVQKNQMMFIVG